MKKYIPLIILLSFLFSCQQEENIMISEEETTELVPEAVTLKGRLRIKFKAETASDLNVVQTRSGVSSGIQAVDLAGVDLNVYRMERVFPYAGKFEERHRQHGLHLWYDVYFDEKIPTKSALKHYKNLPEIESVGEIPIAVPADAKRVEPLMEPLYSLMTRKSGQSEDETEIPFNDPNFPNQWALYNEGESVNGLLGAMAGADINVLKAWQRETGSRNIIVAVIDGGIQYDHPDLKDNMWVNEAEKNGLPGVDDDNNGYIDDIYGFNYVSAKVKKDDQGRTIYTNGKIIPHNHGTHCAGIIAATNNNETGICGIAGGSGNHDGVRMMSLQIFETASDGESNLANANPSAFVYAADMGAVITSNSWGSAGQDETYFINSGLKTAIDYFIKNAGVDVMGNQTGPMKGGLVVFSAGNDNTDVKEFPSGYQKCFSVAALAHHFKKAGYSNFGKWISISAPGGDQSYGSQFGILSTVTGSEYDYYQGTSMACPQVSGCAALVLSKFQGLNYKPDELRERLENSVKEIDGYNQNFVGQLGVGLVDVGNALTPPSTDPPVSSELKIIDAYDDWAIVEWEVKAAPDGPMNRYVISWSEKPMTEWEAEGVVVNHKEISVRKIEAGTLLRDTIGGLEDGKTYYFSLRAYDRWGGVSEPAPEVSATIHANLPPQAVPSWKGSIVLEEGSERVMELAVTDPEGQAVKSYLSSTKNWISLENKDDKVLIKLKPGYQDAGNYQEVVTVEDTYGKKAEVMLQIVVQFKEVVPQQLLPFKDMKIVRNEQAVRLNLTDYFVDPKGRNLLYEVESSDMSVAVVKRLGDILTIEGLSLGKASVLVKAVNAGGVSVSNRFIVEVTPPADYQGEELTAYPNPVSKILNLRLGKDYYGAVTLRLYNAAGRQVVARNVTFDQDGYILDMSGMQAGTYILSIEGEKRSWKKNIIKI